MKSRPRTLSLLQDYLDREFAWRLKEIADLKIAVRQSESLRRKTVIRAAIPLLYAHWEGFVKKASTGYLDFVDYQGHKYQELTSCFIVIGLKASLNEVLDSKRSHTNISAVEFILDGLSKSTNLNMIQRLTPNRILDRQCLKIYP